MECLKHGCRNLQTTCVTCGRIVCTSIFPEINEWISVEDKLHIKEDEWIYIGSSDRKLTTWGILMNGKFVNPDLDYQEIEGVTHWMPIPETPK